MSRGKSGSVFTRLSSKIFMAMGSVLFLFALVLCLYYYIVTMPQNSGIKKSSPHTALLAEQMKTSLMEAQKNESLFLLNPGSDSVSKHKAAITQLLSLSNQFSQNAKQADKINNSVQQLDSAFMDLVQALEVKGFNESSGLLEKLNNASLQLKEIISGNEAGSLALAFLRIQRHEQEYFKTSSSIELRNLQTAINIFSQLLKNTGIEPVDAQVLRKGVIEYNIALDRYQAVSLITHDRSLSATMGMEQQRQADDMRRAADNIESVINRVSVPDALLMVLNIRQDEASYLLFRDEKYAQQVKNGLDALIKTFTSSSILQEHKNRILKAALMYRDAFTSLVEQNTIVNNQLARVNETAASLEGLINKAVKASSITIPETTPPVAGSENNLPMIAAISGLAVILIGFLVAVVLGKSISAPIINMTNIVRRITTDKDFNEKIPVSSNNEIGILAQELNTLLQLQKTRLDQTSSITTDIAGNHNVLTDIANNLHRQIEAVGEASSHMSTSAASQNELAENFNNSVTQLTASADAMSLMFNQSDKQNQLIKDAVEHIGSSIDSTLEGIKDITQSSSQVSDIISLSTEIAEQTNLLALNASVKAARAGSHGKEFAVIADEISKLAQRSEEIAKEASQLTISLSSKVDEAIQLGDESKKSLDQIHEAGRLNLLTAEETAKEFTIINTNTDALGKLAESLVAAFNKIDVMAGEQRLKCTAAQESVENLLRITSDHDDETKDGYDNITLSLKEKKEADTDQEETDESGDTGSAIDEAESTKETFTK